MEIHIMKNIKYENVVTTEIIVGSVIGLVADLMLAPKSKKDFRYDISEVKL